MVRWVMSWAAGTKGPEVLPFAGSRFDNSYCYWNRIELRWYKTILEQKREGETEKCCFLSSTMCHHIFWGLLGCCLSESSHHTNSGDPRPLVSLNHREEKQNCAAFQPHTNCAHHAAHADSASTLVSALMLTKCQWKKCRGVCVGSKAHFY